ncbi:hypothetical protein [Halobaculum sp. D14]|uniref:hypothetical protein n=1 Tax=unclassified Halobaculum TaxID=2640896 RepID=UPI003EB75A1B
MATLIAFLTRLVTSAVDLVVLLVTEAALRDPLAFVSLAVGAVFVLSASAVLGALALGALGREIGALEPAPGRQPR